MIELADRLLPLLADAQVLAVATSIDVTGSAPRLVGTSLAVPEVGAPVGDVSGGCVDAAALHACARLHTGAPPSVLRFGFGDEEAARAGLACGGEVDVLVHRVTGPAATAELRAAAAGRPAALGVVTAGPPALVGRVVCGGEGAGLPGDVADGDLTGLPGISADRLRSTVAGRAATGRPGAVEVACGPDAVRVFVDVAVPAARMVVVGATEVAAALASFAARLGYAVSVVDPRPAFARPSRVPDAVEVVEALAHTYLAATPLDARSVVCLLSHDEDLDPLALAVALERGVAYVGALGSRGTHARRLERLAALGVPPAASARIRAPIGLDLGGSTPAETALSIIVEVLTARTGGTAGALADGAGPVHARAPLPQRPAGTPAAGAVGS